jgi:two-component system, cell cycle response regulator
MLEPRAALDVLIDVTRRLIEERPLEDSLHDITEATLRLLPGTHSSVRLFDESRTELLTGARSGEGAAEHPPTFRRGEGIAGWVAEHGKVTRIDDALVDARFKLEPGQGYTIRSILTVPLWAGGRVVGVLSVTSPQPSAFSDDDEILARLLANCTVPPIEKARLERLALTDHHTLAFNQRYLLPRLHDEIAAARSSVTPLSVLLLDLDHFKRVNDEHGHAVGDAVLRAFADCVRDTVRRQDVLVRRGGEEFVLIMPQTSGAVAARVAERIRTRLASAPVDGGGGVHVAQTVSIGVATWDGNEQPTELEQRADAAMYEAKRRGRNQVAVAERSA